MDPKALAVLMSELEATDPHDLAGLSIGEAEARELMATHLCEIDRRLADQGCAPEERLEIMAAIAAHTLVENFVLHLRRLDAEPQPVDFREWMRRQGLG